MKKKQIKKKNYLLDMYNATVTLDMICLTTNCIKGSFNGFDVVDEVLAAYELDVEYILIKELLKEMAYMYESLKYGFGVDEMFKLKSFTKKISLKNIEFNKTSLLNFKIQVGDLHSRVIEESAKNSYSVEKEKHAYVLIMSALLNDILTAMLIQKGIIVNKKIDRINYNENGEAQIEYMEEELFGEKLLSFATNEMKKQNIEAAADIFPAYSNMSEYIVSNPYVLKLTDGRDNKEIIIINNKIDVDRKYKDSLIDEVNNNKRYVYPNEGVMIKYTDGDSLFDNVEIYETTKDYYLRYEVKDNSSVYNIKKSQVSEDEVTGRLKFDYEIEDRCVDRDYKAIYVCKIQKTDLTRVSSLCNTFIRRGDNLEDRFWEKYSLTLLYTAYCDNEHLDDKILMGRIKRERKVSKKYIKDVYRIAYIRKLPNGYSASKEALGAAKEMGINIPEGYTFVRECNNENAKQKVIKI